MKHYPITLLFIFFCCQLNAQMQEESWRFMRDGKAIHLDSLPPLPTLSLLDYTSRSNPYYWKYRKAKKDYWQQDVHYRIDATLDTKNHIIRGKAKVTYRNNSPDTLTHIYFHLYQNAFLPGSYREQAVFAQNRKPIYGEYESAGKGTEIFRIAHNRDPVRYKIDNTVLEVYLNSPLAPGYNADVDIEFATYFDKGSEERRMALLFEEVKNAEDSVYTVPHYNGVLWYPRVAVYDRVFSWHLDQHIGKEFYGEFGSFDVHLTLPAHFILDATGRLINEEEALPETLKAKIDIRNFAEKPWEEVASEVLPPDTNVKKTWIFHALNVHDFAFTADPTYRRGETRIDDSIRCVALARERHASRWQDAADFTAQVISVYNHDVGYLAYPKMIAADADDGMEYPMLTLDGEASPEYYSLLAHEIGHNWFYGMVGTNETYRAMMDEGFTQFLNVWSMDKLVDEGDYPGKANNMSWTRWSEVYYDYLKDAREGYTHPLNIHSNAYGIDFSTGYGQVYEKPTVMLYNLRYVLGDKVFWGAMQHYVEKWKMMHPYPEDFREAVTEYVNTDLTWFFDAWLNTNKQIDYAVKRVKKKKEGKLIEVTFERKGEMQMPVDFTVITKKKDSLRYTIPNTTYHKKEPGLKVLPKWTGWDNIYPTYTTTLQLPYEVKKVVIDSDRYLGDVNLLDNQSGFLPFRVALRLTPTPEELPSWERYSVAARPNFWWNGYSGIQAGMSLSGNYMGDDHVTDLGVWYNTGIGKIDSRVESLLPFEDDYHPISYKIEYKTPIRGFGRNYELSLRSAFRDGLQRHEAGISKRVAIGSKDNPAYHLFSAKYKYLEREENAWSDYLIEADAWTPDTANASVILSYEKGYRIRNGTGNIELTARSSFLFGEKDYSYLALETQNERTWLNFHIKWRAIARYGLGQTPLESQLYLAGGSPEEMYESEFYRARGWFPNSFLENDQGRVSHNMHFGGGLNLRGYSGYRAEFGDNTPSWHESGGAGVNVEIEFDRFFPFRLPLVGDFITARTYFFYDAGVMSRIKPGTRFEPEPGRFRQDLGLGAALEIRDGYFFSEEKPLVLRIDAPIFVSRPPALEDYFKMRWVIGIGRSF